MGAPSVRATDLERTRQLPGDALITDSIFRTETETRVTTTDPTARAKFRWYWARFSPGIVVIRRVALGLLKTDAEHRALETPQTRPTR